MPRKSREYNYIAFVPLLYENLVLWDPKHPQYRLAGPTKAAYRKIQKQLNITGTVFKSVKFFDTFNFWVNYVTQKFTAMTCRYFSSFFIGDDAKQTNKYARANY